MCWRLLLCVCVAWVSNAFVLTSQPRSLSCRNKDGAMMAALGNDNDGPTRREAIQIGAMVLSTLLVPGTFPEPVYGEEPKTIVLTGGNSGIGFEAVKRLASSGHTVILPCRTLKRSQEAIERLDTTSGTLIAAECDLSSIRSIKEFAKDLSKRVDKIDVLALNAGLSRDVNAKDIKRTEDGFELTVGTNHFGHFALNKLLLPMVNPIGGRIVVTASGVHDPESPGGSQGEKASLGDLLGLDRDGKYFEMVDGNPFNADKAYKDSKLCNVLFTRELQKRLDASSDTKGISVNCFTPGLIVTTGLFRDQNPFFIKVFDVAATNVFKVGETPEWGGGALVYMTTSVDSRGAYYGSPPGSSRYGEAAFGKQFRISEVSKEAQDDAKAKRLWELTDKLVGV